MKGCHAKAKSERFTAASSCCRQNLKYENFTSSFCRLRQIIAPKRVPHVQLTEGREFKSNLRLAFFRVYVSPRIYVIVVIKQKELFVLKKIKILGHIKLSRKTEWPESDTMATPGNEWSAY